MRHLPWHVSSTHKLSNQALDARGSYVVRSATPPGGSKGRRPRGVAAQRGLGREELNVRHPSGPNPRVFGVWGGGALIPFFAGTRPRRGRRSGTHSDTHAGIHSCTWTHKEGHETAYESISCQTPGSSSQLKSACVLAFAGSYCHACNTSLVNSCKPAHADACACQARACQARACKSPSPPCVHTGPRFESSRCWRCRGCDVLSA